MTLQRVPNGWKCPISLAEAFMGNSYAKDLSYIFQLTRLTHIVRIAAGPNNCHWAILSTGHGRRERPSPSSPYFPYTGYGYLVLLYTQTASLRRDCYDRAPTTIGLSQQCGIMEGVNAPHIPRCRPQSPWVTWIVNLRTGMGASGFRPPTLTFISR